MITRIKSASSNSKIDLEIRLDWHSSAPQSAGDNGNVSRNVNNNNNNNNNSQPSTPPVLSPTYTRSEFFDSTNASAVINPLEMGKIKTKSFYHIIFLLLSFL
jgi:hypothetical protein